MDDGHPVRLEIPAYFEVGVPATVEAYTYGGGCDRAGPTLLEVSGLLAVIEPYDSVPAPGADLLCPSVLGPLSHTVQVEFLEPGEATVRLIGIRQYAGGDSVMRFDTTAVVR